MQYSLFLKLCLDVFEWINIPSLPKRKMNIKIIDALQNIKFELKNVQYLSRRGETVTCVEKLLLLILILTIIIIVRVGHKLGATAAAGGALREVFGARLIGRGRDQSRDWLSTGVPHWSLKVPNCMWTRYTLIMHWIMIKLNRFFAVSGLSWGMYRVSDGIFMCHLVYISSTCWISQCNLLDGKGKVLINIQQHVV